MNEGDENLIQNIGHRTWRQYLT